MKSLGIAIIVFGGILIITGLIFVFSDKIPFLGRLPGDIRVKGENSSFYFPKATCIIISIVLSVLLNLFFRFFRK